MSNVDLSWMNVPGPDGLTWAQKNGSGSVDLSWMNIPGADGQTFLQKQQKIADPSAGTTEDQNAFSILKQRLQNLGLEGMTDKTWQFMVENGTDDDAGTMLWLYQQPEFEQRFPAFKTLQKKYKGIQPAQYIMLERQYAQTMRSAGLSANFFDSPDDFTALIENDVSQAEFQERVDNGFKKVAEASPAVRNAFNQYFGIEGDAALAAFFIDPDRSAPKLAKAAQMAELGGAASAMGVQINANYAAKLTRLGISEQQALEGFKKMQRQRALFSGGINETAITPQSTTQFNSEMEGTKDTSKMTTADQLGVDYTFGTDVEVERQLELRLAQRKAETSGISQQTTVDRQGRTSIGTAD
jgi:hypothetical protein